MDTFQRIFNILCDSEYFRRDIHFKTRFRKKHFEYKPHDTHKKFNIIRKIVLNDNLESQTKKDCVEEIFILSQIYYYLISKYAFKYKLKKAKIYHNNYDFNMTQLNELSNDIKISLYDKPSNLIYIFRISDIINIINNSLAYMEDYKFTANKIKNPYTNIEFNKATLYNIYFALKNSTFIMPELFHQYFLANFNIQKYIIYNNNILRQHAIKQHINTANLETKHQLI